MSPQQSTSWAAGSQGEPPARQQRSSRRSEALANLSEVHAQLSSKVQLLQSLAPRLGAHAGGEGSTGDTLTAAAVAAAAAALAAAGTRAAEEVGALAAAGARQFGGASGDSSSTEEIQHHLVERMETIRQQLSNICSDLLEPISQEGQRGEAQHEEDEEERGDSDGVSHVFQAEASWGSLSGRDEGPQ